METQIAQPNTSPMSKRRNLTRARAFSCAMDAAAAITDSEEPWMEVMRTARAIVGADAGCFMAWNRRTGRLESFIQTGHEAAAESEYLEHYCDTDVVAKKAITLPVGKWLSSDWLLTAAQWEKEEFYVDFLRRFRIEQIFGFALLNDENRFAALAFHCHTANRHVEKIVRKSEIARLQNRMIASYTKRIVTAQNTHRALLSVLDQEREAVCVVQSTGVVDFFSPVACEWLAEGQYLSLRARRLQHSSERANRLLLLTIGRVLADDHPRWVVLTGGWGETFRLRVSRPSEIVGTGNGRCVIVRIERRNVFCIPDEELLRQTFELTGAESRVFRHLIAGHDAKACAALSGVAVGTVRKQIASILKKTGCYRQSELIRQSSLL